MNGSLDALTWFAGVVLQTPEAQAPQTGSGFSLVPGISPETQAQLVISLLVVLGLVFARRALLSLVARHVEDTTLLYRWAKGTSYTAFLIGFLILIQVWFAALRSVGTFLGLLSAGIAIALKDLVADIAGWLFILWRRPFDLGDRIQLGNHAGDVIDLRIFQFSLMEIGNWVDADQSTGRVIHVPNAKIFTESLANYTHGFPYLWNELPVVVTFESDWRKARALLEEVSAEETADVVREAQGPQKKDRRFLIHFRTLTPAVYMDVVDVGVRLTVRHLTRPRERRGTAQRIWERIMDAVDASPDVALAYPTQRLLVEAEPPRPRGETGGGS